MSPKTHPCSHCNFKAKNKAGLTSHVRSHKLMAMEADAPAVTTMPEPAPAPVVPEPKAPAKPAQHAHDPKDSAHVTNGVCKHCNMLPVGSVELVSLLLVLVFALTAVLLTSIYVIETQA